MERIGWLRENTSLGSLSEEALGAIAASIQTETVQENRRLVLEDTPPIALYILRLGHLESYRTRKDSTADAIGLLPGSVVHLKELLLDQPAERTVITLDECEIWTITREEFLALVQEYPEISQTLSRQLATELDQMAAQLVYERDRQAALRPYLLPKVRRGVVGSSRYAVRLRQEIKKASGDRRSVLIFGEPGLGKDNLCALIHFGSAMRHEPMIKNQLRHFASQRRRSVWAIGRQTRTAGMAGAGNPAAEQCPRTRARVAEKAGSPAGNWGICPCDAGRRNTSQPQTLRGSDHDELRESAANPGEKDWSRDQSAAVTGAESRHWAQTDYYIGLFCRSRGLPKPKVTPEALRRLQSYDFPGNFAELEGLIERAVIQSNGAARLTEEVFWETSPKAKRFRFNLLNAYPKLRQFLKTPWFPRSAQLRLHLWRICLGSSGADAGPPKSRCKFRPQFFLGLVVAGILVAFPFVGRLWCSVCPFMIYGEVAQKLSLWLFPRKLLPWPRQEAEQWGGWFLFGLFALILLWEELWDLENTAYLSGCLLLLITAGAVIFSLLFERRFWCRYLCPIGGMNGLFAKLSVIELRAQQGTCSATCTTYQCYKGGPQKGEGLETNGCPLYSTPPNWKTIAIASSA